MDNIPRFYLRLYNSTTDAIALIDDMNFGSARETLIEGQRWAEELYLAEMEGELTPDKELAIWLGLKNDRMRAEGEEIRRLDQLIRAAREEMKEERPPAEAAEETTEDARTSAKEAGWPLPIRGGRKLGA